MKIRKATYFLPFLLLLSLTSKGQLYLDASETCPGGTYTYLLQSDMNYHGCNAENITWEVVGGVTLSKSRDGWMAEIQWDEDLSGAYIELSYIMIPSTSGNNCPSNVTQRFQVQVKPQPKQPGEISITEGNGTKLGSESCGGDVLRIVTTETGAQPSDQEYVWKVNGQNHKVTDVNEITYTIPDNLSGKLNFEVYKRYKVSECRSYLSLKRAASIDVSPKAPIPILKPISPSCIGEKDGGVEVSGLPSGTYDITISSVSTNIHNFNFSNVYFTDGESIIFSEANKTNYPESDGDIIRIGNGDWEIQINQAGKCSRTARFTITDPLPPSLTLTAPLEADPYHLKCNGGSSGVIEYTISNGLPDFTVEYLKEIDGQFFKQGSLIVGTGTHKLTNLLAGTYKVNVTDACNAVVSQEITLTEPPAITFTATHTDVTCNGNNNGEIVISGVSGGNGGAYEYSKDGGVNFTIDPIFQSLPSGIYQVVVRDGQQCNSKPVSVEIIEPTELGPVAPEFLISDPTCFGGDGSIKITSFSGGGTPFANNEYTYELLQVDGRISTVKGELATFSTVKAGTYSLRVSDANGCVKTYSDIFTVTEPSELIITYEEPLFTHFGDVTADILVTILEGTPSTTGNPYQISLTPAVISDNQIMYDAGKYTLSGVPATMSSTFQLQATDANECRKSTDVSVTPYQYITNVLPTPALCNGQASGKINFTINWTEAGNVYLIELFDANGGKAYSAEVSSLTPEIPGLRAGTYRLTVSQYNPATQIVMSGRSYTVSNIIVGEPTDITANLDTDFFVQPVDCKGSSTGSIIRLENITGGSGDPASWAYAWYKGVDCSVESNFLQNGKELKDQPVGEYVLKVTDSNGCFKCFVKSVAEPEAIDFTFTQTDESCQGNKDASIYVSSSLNVLDPLYVLYNDQNVEVTRQQGLYDFQFTNLAAGTYKIVLTDQAKGCQVEKQVVVEQRNFALVQHSIRHVSCFGGNDGYIKVNVIEGTPNYTFTIVNKTTGGVSSLMSNEATGLSAGSYEIRVKDAKACTASHTFTINQPATALQAASSNTKPDYCQTASGIASVIVSGGTAPYTYQWNDEKGQTTAEATGLAAGGYQVTVKDVNGCITVSNVTVSSSKSAISATETITPYYCASQGGGIQLKLSGEASPFKVSFYKERVESVSILKQVLVDPSTGTDVAEISELAAGNYAVEVIDANKCSKQFFYTVGNNGLLVKEESKVITKSTCGQANGAFSFTISGGIPPYIVELNGTQTQTNGDFTATNLKAGVNYVATIKDQTICSYSLPLSVEDIDAPALALVPPIKQSYCDQANGAAEVAASGGSGNYIYQWLNADGDIILEGKVFNKATGLQEGTYQVSVKDEMTGCSSKFIAVSIEDLPDPVLSVSLLDSAACNQPLGRAMATLESTEVVFYQWYELNSNQLVNEGAEASGLMAGIYKVVATESRGCVVELLFEMPEKANPTLQFISKEASACGKALGWAEVQAAGGTGYFIYTWINEATGESFSIPSTRAEKLVKGRYLVYAKDENGCMSNELVIAIEEKQEMLISLEQLTSTSCSDAADGTIEISIIGGTEPYTYQWNDAQVQTTAMATGLVAGEYTVVVKDVNGCETNATFIVEAPEVLRVSNWIINKSTCRGACDGNLEVLIEGGTAPYTYLWSDVKKQTTAKAGGLCAGTYTVRVTDAKGCSFTTSAELREQDEVQIEGIPAEVTICNGQRYKLDAGDMWKSYAWTSDNGFRSNVRTVNLDRAGRYYLQVESYRGCVARDTFDLVVSSSLLSADFLVASEAVANDTVMLVDISWPVPDRVKWTYTPADQHKILTNLEFVQEVIFLQPGTYEIRLEAFMAGCVSEMRKVITINNEGPEQKDNGNQRVVKDVIQVAKLYPNPNRGRFMAEVELSDFAPVRLEVIDIYTARVLKSLSFENEKSLNTALDVTDLKDGLYLLRISTEDSAKNIRFYIQK